MDWDPPPNGIMIDIEKELDGVFCCLYSKNDDDDGVIWGTSTVN